MHKKLFIPGPVDVRPEVLEKMATPMIGHRTADASKLQERISDNVRKLFHTNNTVVLSTSSGSGLMESAIRCCCKKGAAVFSVGSFGDRWYEMALANGKVADKFDSPDGLPTTPEMVDEALKTGKYDTVTVTQNETSSGIMNPVEAIGEVVKKYDDVLLLVDAVSGAAGSNIEVDKWGIDMLITSTQKCIGLPPGMSMATVSDRAYERAKTVEQRGFYLDLVKLVDRVKKDYQYPSTPSLSHMFALDYQLDYILNVEGFENRLARHAKMAKMVQDWAVEHGFKLFAREDCRSMTVTCICNDESFDFKAVNAELGKRGYAISNGYGKNKGKTFRIAHMADHTVEEMQELLDTLSDVLKELKK